MTLGFHSQVQKGERERGSHKTSLASAELGAETGSRGPSPRPKLKLERSILEGKGDLKQVFTTNKKQVRKVETEFSYWDHEERKF